MAEVRKAVREDIPAILNLLSELNPAIHKDLWQKCFRSEFNSDAQPGVVIEEEGVIGAFLGTILVKRCFNNWNYTSCNIWGWVVREPHRAQSLQMLNEVLKWDCVFTCYSPMELTYRILKKFGFIEIQKNYQITSKPKSPIGKGIKVRSLTLAEASFGMEENEIIRFHKDLPCKIICLEIRGRNLLMVFKPEKARSEFISKISALPIIGRLFKPEYMKLEYASDFSLLREIFHSSVLKLMIELKSIGLIIPGDLHMNVKNDAFRSYAGRRKYLWKPHPGMPSDFKPDTLFSELLILGLPG